MVDPGISQIIENHISVSKSFEFQQMCNRLLIKLYPDDYQPTRAAGRYGDMKNDGYCCIKRIFFHCHATRGQDFSILKAKFKSDLGGCLQWQTDVRELIFLTNDTNAGRLERHIDEIRNIKNRKVITWGVEILTDKISQFSIDTIEYILGFKLNAQKNSEPYAIKYEISKGSEKILTKSELRRKSIIFLISMLFFFVSIVLLFKYGLIIERPYILYTPFMFVVISLMYYRPFRWGWVQKSETLDKYILGRFINRTENGDYYSYTMEAPCSFENCKGTVKIKYAPPRERFRFTIIGGCNKNETTHTYTFDSDGNGYPLKMDFRPLETESNR